MYPYSDRLIFIAIFGVTSLDDFMEKREVECGGGIVKQYLFNIYAG